jgi:hypothetical protein
LRVGERIRTKTGTARIEAIRWKKGEHRVYNIEVEADHAYFVSEGELLSHNAGGCGKLAERATEIHSALKTGTQGRTTTAIVDATDASGKKVKLVASSENALRPAQREVLKRGEIAVTGTGHAEVTALNAAKQMGLKPRKVAASRPICPNCAKEIDEAGAEAVSRLKN